MWKYSKLFNCKWLFMQIIALSISLNEAASCTDCSITILGTTTSKPTTTNGWETRTKYPEEISTTLKAEQTAKLNGLQTEISTTLKAEQTTKLNGLQTEISTTLKAGPNTKDKISEAEQQTTLSDSDRTESHSTTDLDKNITVTTGTNGNSDLLTIAIPLSGIVALILGALSIFVIQRYCNKNKKPKKKDSMEIGSIQHQQPTVHERTTYENYTPTSDESGYEVPNQVDNKNEQSGYEVPIPVDNKNEQQYEVVRSGAEYQYENA